MRYSFKVMHDEVPTVKVRSSRTWARLFGLFGSLRELEGQALLEKGTRLVCCAKGAEQGNAI